MENVEKTKWRNEGENGDLKEDEKMSVNTKIHTEK